MKQVLIPCDECSKIFLKKKSKLRKVNFCSRECMDKYNSKRFHNYNEIENPMNAKGRTIDERFEMRMRRKNSRDRIGKETHTYNKQLGEPEHRKIMRLKLGRPLRDDEIVHHKDGDLNNNKPSNLQVMTRGEHARMHMLEYWRKKHEKK